MSPKLFLTCTVALLFAVVVPINFAATPPAKPAANTTPIVTVTKNDGSTVHGKLTAAGPGSITVEAPGVGAVHPTEIPWREIKSVSNGLTQAKALQQFRTEHPDEICETCHGTTTLVCATCKGTGHDPASGKDCKTCGGELLVPCKTPKCKDGKIPCPAPCLKFSEGEWTTREGLRVRIYRSKGGEGWISERHLGTLVSFDKNGQMIDKGVCPTCGGTTTVTDPTCNGTSKIPCPTCVARKDAPACPAHCDHGHEICKACGGTGIKGKGAAATPAADGSTPSASPPAKEPKPLPF